MHTININTISNFLMKDDREKMKATAPAVAGSQAASQLGQLLGVLVLY